jgi:adenylate cyclase
MISDNNRFTHELATRLVESGAPIDGLRIMVRTLNPQVLAYSDFWSSSDNTTHTATARHGVRSTDRYIGSPLQVLLEEHRTLHQPLGDFTKKANGFDAADVERLHRLRDYLAPVLELHSIRHTAISVMNTYVGQGTGRKILNGMIQRGDADLINAALWFSDLRNFTHLTETLPARQLLDMLNDYFEFVSAAVSARGGEILRFIGDAMLIVFPIDENTSHQTACNAAIDAALDACNTLATLNHRRQRQAQPPIEFGVGLNVGFGVGLNVGEVIYGNVGAPDRLDFTVMGPAVNRTARLESLTKELDTNILFSQEFSNLIDAPVQDLGDHPMKGIDGLQKVFGLAEV